MLNHTDQSNNVTDISNVCLTPYQCKVYLTITHFLIFVSLDGIILLCNLVANALVTFIIVRTNQLSNTAFKLIYNLSLAGVG